MKNVYYPLAGMNYIIDDLAEIIKNKMENKKEINLWLSAQVNMLSTCWDINKFYFRICSS